MESKAAKTKEYLSRNSGIELLKIIAIVLIVLNHCIQTLSEPLALIDVPGESIINLWNTTSDPITLLLAFLRSSGYIGNTVFFVCSAWFFVGKESSSKKKAVFLVTDIWVVSVLLLILSLILGADIDKFTIIRQFFPTTNSHNWFLTCYILFYLAYPLLNKLISALNRKRLLLLSAFMTFLYIICSFIKPWFFEDTLFFGNILMVWLTIYFIIAYIKLYLPDLSSSKKANIICLFIGIFGQAAITLLIDLGGMKFYFFRDSVLYFNNASSPFIILTALCAFNIARMCRFHSRFINYIASLSLLIYIFHENYLLRGCFRPLIFVYIYQHFGYDHILLWVLLVTLAIFIASAAVSIIYRETLERLVRIAADRLYVLIKKIWTKLEDKLLKLH